MKDAVRTPKLEVLKLTPVARSGYTESPLILMFMLARCGAGQWSGGWQNNWAGLPKRNRRSAKVSNAGDKEVGVMGIAVEVGAS